MFLPFEKCELGNTYYALMDFLSLKADRTGFARVLQALLDECRLFWNSGLECFQRASLGSLLDWMLNMR